MSWQALFSLPRDQRPAHRIHLVGIGGTGLAPIANVLLEMGFQVSGSDQQTSARTEALAAASASVHLGHDPAHLLPRPDLVLISSAIAAANPEVAAARAAGIPVVKRRELLGPLLAGRRVIAVAGTHGKTTTTGMIAHLLSRGGRPQTAATSASSVEPGYIIGSDIPGLGQSRAGEGDWFVIEADEYDYAFLGLTPEIIVLTSLEWDHPDCFPTPAAYFAAFERFSRQLRAGGSVVYCRSDANLRALAAAQGGPGWQGYSAHAGADWQARGIEIGPEGVCYTLQGPDGVEQPVQLAVPGLHNVLNSAAALIAAGLAGLPLATAAPLLASFRGAARRFEIKGEAGGVLVIDDYAHHPTEIRSTLAAARALYPQRQIWAVYEPHTFSRTRALLDQFEGVFAAADHLLVTDIYPAREAFDPGISPAQIVAASRHPQAVASGSLEETRQHLQGHVQPGGVVILLSAGPATALAGALLAAPLSPSLLAALRPLARYGVQENAALAPHTSFQIGGPAAAL
ncbi:MAG: UDP-N-acetylmuramate--L-alanine ligase, partial [Caldilineales bacterium]|nr:UDP-N-acetylmuramate--L-alanine ligase [Caldilineales bacterium]